jgi:hypothetical protein
VLTEPIAVMNASFLGDGFPPTSLSIGDRSEGRQANTHGRNGKAARAASLDKSKWNAFHPAPTSERIAF